MTVHMGSSPFDRSLPQKIVGEAFLKVLTQMKGILLVLQRRMYFFGIYSFIIQTNFADFYLAGRSQIGIG